MGSVIRRSGIDVIGDVPWGTHFCQFYETSQDLIEPLVPYFREGLAANEFCMWVTSEPLKVDQAIAALRAAVPNLDDYIAKGQIEILDYSRWYTRSGKFSADEVLQGWIDKLNAAFEKGYEGLRLSGNTFWLEQADWDDFTRYEEAVNNVIGQYRMLAICTYCLQKCSALEILDVVSNHQFALIKRSGQWQIIKSAQQLKTAQALQEIEQRYATTLASIGDAVIATDTDGKITFMNAVAEKLTGWTFYEASMRPVTDVFNIINEHTRQKVDDPVAKVLELGAIVGLANHTVLIRKDGTEAPIDDSGAPIKDSDDKIMGVVLVFRDITERKRAEDERELLASFPQLNPNPIIEVDMAGNVHFLNPAAKQLFPDLQERGSLHPWLADWIALAQDFSKNEAKMHVRDIPVGDGWYQQTIYYVPNKGRFRIYGLDITKRKQFEEKLRQANERLELAQRASGVGVWDWDIAKDQIEWSSALFDLFGFDPQKDVASFEAWNSVLHPGDLEIAGLRLDQALKEHTGLNSEYRIIRPDGQVRWINALGHGTYDDQGRPVRMMGICVDITERKEAEEALRESEDRYRGLFKGMTEGFALHEIICDDQGVPCDYRFLDVNPAFERLTCLKREDILGRTHNEILPGDDPRWVKEYGAVTLTGEPANFENYSPALGRHYEVFAYRSAPLQFAVLFMDITERKKMEEDLRTSERLYRAIGESIDYGVWVCDPDGRNIYASPSFLKLLGITQEQCSDFGWGDTLDPADTERTIKAWKECIQTEGTWDIEHRFRGKDDMWHYILARGVPVKDDNGKIICWAGINLDINRLKRAENELRKSKEEFKMRVQERTAELSQSKEELECMNEELRMEIEEHRRAEEALIKAKEAAEVAAEAKAAFLANMSHELRTPMNAVIGYTSLLLDDDLNVEQKEFIEGIRNGGEAMMALIADILEFSRADKKKIEFEHRPISLRHCVEESLDMVALEANKKGLNLAYTFSYGTPDTIIGDHGRLRQILVNLIGNAIKFTDKGDISVSVSSQVVEGNQHQIHFSVTDTGIGIPTDKITKIFEPFTQLEGTISRKREGVGLGLAITKNLVELMGGKIWAESIPGQGTTFHVMIRAESIPGRQPIVGNLDINSVKKSVPGPGKKALRILVAEDNSSNQKVLVKMLKRMGYRPDAVADGQEVIQALERQSYDLILMDVRMPEMDGITATQMIRKLLPKNGPTIVAITAYALESDREKCLEAGMDDYLSKPVQKNELEAILIKYSGGEN